MTTRELTASRTRRHLAAARAVWPGRLPTLSAEERELLIDWLRGSADTRPWQSLLQAAGPGRIELADALSQRALEAGLATRHERSEHGRWWPVKLCWVELEALQAALGLATRSDREARTAVLAQRLETLMADDLVGEAAQALAEARMATAAVEARAALLEALRRWAAEGRSGLRRDFALHLGHTKAISAGEWGWLERHFDLPALGIDAFAPTLALAGDARLCWPGERLLDLGVAPFLTLPVDALQVLQRVDAPPARWWLIENRASFEKQAARRVAGDALVWIAGRPTRAWGEAMARLLALAPAPAAISADADPAGIEIALAAAEPWERAGLPWAAVAMEPERLDRSGLQPLGRYDYSVLQRLALRDLPLELAALRDALAARGVKAEQEGWL
ncbi:hypothetical protein [Pelomonas cellulosilytica]|uniref:DUF2399 domain-containing protein n=1 Tax=Pelomonas cellulosilytica TaxID=2906762 RepID=A0ABS8XZJ1_9BURK|nr:hypothetical protein [Pelomonas sp. P8]MCE4556690.1 hypothetical protein [Pelomonas sp. P8]